MSKASTPMGLKRICTSCGTRFYDLNKRPIICPNCSTEFTGDVKLKSRRGRLPAEEKKIDPKKIEVESDEDEILIEDEEIEVVSLEDVEEADDDEDEVVKLDDDDGLDDIPDFDDEDIEDDEEDPLLDEDED